MIEHACQILELLLTCFVRTVVYLLLVGWAFQMLIEADHAPKNMMADIALEIIPVPSVVGGPRFLVPFQEIVCENSISVSLT